MTNAQKWVTAFLAVFIFLFVLSGLVKEDDIVVPENIQQYAESEDNQETAQDVSGLTLIKQNGCLSCHGQDLKVKIIKKQLKM